MTSCLSRMFVEICSLLVLCVNSFSSSAYYSIFYCTLSHVWCGRVSVTLEWGFATFLACVVGC